MIFPNHHTDSDGNIKFEITHISESRAEQKKPLFDKNTYGNYITVNPLTFKVIKVECTCYDFQINRGRESACKHLRETLALLYNYGITEE